MRSDEEIEAAAKALFAESLKDVDGKPDEWEIGSLDYDLAEMQERFKGFARAALDAADAVAWRPIETAPSPWTTHPAPKTLADVHANRVVSCTCRCGEVDMVALSRGMKPGETRSCAKCGSTVSLDIDDVSLSETENKLSDPEQIRTVGPKDLSSKTGG